jgi:hypothetical protein
MESFSLRHKSTYCRGDVVAVIALEGIFVLGQEGVVTIRMRIELGRLCHFLRMRIN